MTWAFLMLFLWHNEQLLLRKKGGKIGTMLTRFFTISSRTLAFLEKLKTVFDSWLAPLALLLLGITYFFIEINRQVAIVLSIISLFLIFTYLILGAYLFIRIRFFLWKNGKEK
ncbi:hypothetical protein [Streptococcus gallolyticus]|nr:hypothetical protein [Streptococcus gallolyticus]